MKTLSLTTAERILLLSGVVMLVSAYVIYTFDSFVLWTAAKIIFGAGIITLFIKGT